jgi:thiol peroxidase|tara:strand:- start:5686 stop:6219 length:534 start_codon:yes stop_codon:yes gene_type:complete
MLDWRNFKQKLNMAKITLGGKETHTNGELPAIGTPVKNYTFVKNDMSAVQLADFKGKKVILNIFPSIDTGVCMASVRKFNEEAAKLSNAAVLCVSKDLPFALNRFCGAEGIENVTVASDFRTPEFAEDMGLKIAEGAFSGLNSRVIIVLDEEGKVKYTEQVPEIGQEPNYSAALAAV